MTIKAIQEDDVVGVQLSLQPVLPAGQGAGSTQDLSFPSMKGESQKSYVLGLCENILEQALMGRDPRSGSGRAAASAPAWTQQK